MMWRIAVADGLKASLDNEDEVSANTPSSSVSRDIIVKTTYINASFAGTFERNKGNSFSVNIFNDRDNDDMPAGDAALGLAISNLVFLQYPDADPGKLSLVPAANISTEKLARVAVHHQFYKYVRRNAVVLDEKAIFFSFSVFCEEI
ncbi:ribonuclease 3-like protein 2 [Andrographis paniculata]|uniref:ribonuclease 3-like protein 2 n=1 Tax=Andrographis paniculata TaxID=175694 RepID=UPI0021E785FB|nr:ribonuclease 3-like protein 2 [Andrographis paniculata]